MTLLSALRKLSKATTCCSETLDDTSLGKRTQSLGLGQPRNSSTPINNPHYVYLSKIPTPNLLEPDQFMTPLQSPTKTHNVVLLLKRPRNLYIELQESVTPSARYSPDPQPIIQLDESTVSEYVTAGHGAMKCGDVDCMVCAFAKPELRRSCQLSVQQKY